MVIVTPLDQSRSVLGFLWQIAREQSVLFLSPVLSESRGNLQIVSDQHVSRNDECVAETTVSGNMR